MIKYDDLDDAIVGITDDVVSSEKRYIYDYDKCVEVFMTKGLTEEESIEWIQFNIIGGYLGKKTPIIMRREYEDEE
jgi:hypothetical protein